MVRSYAKRGEASVAQGAAGYSSRQRSYAVGLAEVKYRGALTAPDNAVRVSESLCQGRYKSPDSVVVMWRNMPILFVSEA